MTHEKYQRIRWICMLCGTVYNAALIACIVLAIVCAGSPFVGNVLIPVIIAANAIYIVLFILLGRIFCGFFCPLGCFQDVLWKVTEKLHLPKFHRGEKFMKILYVFNRVFFVFFLCAIAALLVLLIFFPSVLQGVVIPIFAPVIIGFFMLTLNCLARRFFCNVCPFGSFVGLFERWNLIRLEKDSGACTSCGACYEACPMRIKSVYLEDKKAKVSTNQCLFCGQCVKKCPEDHALAITLRGRKIYESSEEDFLKHRFDGITVSAKDKN